MANARHHRKPALLAIRWMPLLAVTGLTPRIIHSDCFIAL